MSNSWLHLLIGSDVTENSLHSLTGYDVIKNPLHLLIGIGRES